MPLVKILALLLSLLVILYLAWKRPGTLVSLLAAAIAFDISTEFYPSLHLLGRELGTVSLTRLVTMGVFAAALYQLWRSRERRAGFRRLLRQPLSIAVLIYIGVGAFSVIYSIGRGQTVLEVIRLLSLFALFLGLGVLIDGTQVRRVFQAVHWVGLALVPLALYEAATRRFIWHSSLAEGQIARVNATFVDPNIFARYLVLAITANLVLQLTAKGSSRKAVYYASLFALLGGLAVTLSRSGIVTLACVLAALAILVPKRDILLPMGLLAAAGLAIVLSRPTVLNRLSTLKEGLAALDAQRQYLWQASFAMFKSHPVFGVGLGGFQKSFLTHYSALKTVPEGATLSHTTILTIAAELGSMGLLALLYVWICLLKLIINLRAKPLQDYAYGVGYFLWVGTVFISSQSEARFFEDPIIWISMAMLLFLAGRKEPEGKSKLGITTD